MSLLHEYRCLSGYPCDGGASEWIRNIDQERAKIAREAWELLLEDTMSVREIAEAIHERGYRHRTGRPFVELTSTGKRKANINSLCNIFHNLIKWS